MTVKTLAPFAPFEQLLPGTVTIEFTKDGALAGDAKIDSICGACGKLVLKGMGPLHLARMAPGVPLAIKCPHCGILLKPPSAGD